MGFNDIINQDRAKKVISGQLKSSRISHAYLFLGPEGVGKKKFALEFAKTLNCKNNLQNPQEPCGSCISCNKINNNIHPDVQVIDFYYQARLEDKEVEKQRTIKIDTIRALQKEISLKATEGKWKVFIIEPAEKITPDAANCLLKTLEEPPSGTVIILLAVHKDNLPATVVSRTQILRFSPLSADEVADFVAKKHGVGHKKACEIAGVSEGSLERAVDFIDKDIQDVETLWDKIKEKSVTTSDALMYSQEYFKQADDFLMELLMVVKNDFRKSPLKFNKCIEKIMYSQKILEKNANAQIVLDELLLKLNKLAYNV